MMRPLRAAKPVALQKAYGDAHLNLSWARKGYAVECGRGGVFGVV